MLGDHVTLEAGTGAVHTAPGHGVDDYKIGMQVTGCDDLRAGRRQAASSPTEFPQMQGQFVFKANEADHRACFRVVGPPRRAHDIQHSYPHCWRCHNPVIFRATPQWFIGMERRASGLASALRQKRRRRSAK